MKTYTTPKQLLTTNNAKTIKSMKYNVTTYIMYLAPFTQNSLGINLCSHASKGCAKACLFSSGAARFPKVQQGKINKTEYFLADRKLFLEQLDAEITKITETHSKIKDVTLKANGEVLRNKEFSIRLNGTSDIRFEKFKIRDNKNIFELHPNVQFYDYTKNHLRFKVELPKNYHLTFSRSEDNDKKSFELLRAGFNVAMVFGVKKNLPTSYNGFKVINGDKSDLRYKDEANVIVGLKYKKATGKNVNNKEILKENDFIINIEEEEEKEVIV